MDIGPKKRFAQRENKIHMETIDSKTPTTAPKSLSIKRRKGRFDIAFADFKSILINPYTIPKITRRIIEYIVFAASPALKLEKSIINNDKTKKATTNATKLDISFVIPFRYPLMRLRRNIKITKINV